MPSQILQATLLAAMLSVTAVAQTAIWTPAGYSAMSGNAYDLMPWGRNNSPTHYQQIYGAANFTAQGVSVPVVISRLRFRNRSFSSGSLPGGSWPNVTLKMSTAAMRYTAASATFAANHGNNLTTVYAGPVTVMPVTSNGPYPLPGPVDIDIPLNAPFLYDPSAGDLCLEVQLFGAGWSGGFYLPVCDEVSTPAPMARIYEGTSATSSVGSVDRFTGGLVTEFTCLPAGGYASVLPYGTGCYDDARASFYQVFYGTFPSTFNLTNSAIQMVPTGTGYVVTAGSNTWWTPVGANLGLSDNSVSGPLALGFTLNYPGGSTSNVYACSNGFVWMQPSNNAGCCHGEPGDLLAMGARVCPLWAGLTVQGGGTAIFDVDAPNQTAYVTWTNVWEQGSGRPNTFQVAFHASGQIDMRWQACLFSYNPAVTGWSPGGSARNTGNINILTALPITTAPDRAPLVFTASARPLIGNTINMLTSSIPAGTPVGAEIFSYTQHNPGIDLTSIGMPGCLQYVGLDFTSIFAVSGGSASVALGVPGNPALAGVRVRAQSATFSAGLNPLGVLASNGLTLLLDLQ